MKEILVGLRVTIDVLIPSASGRVFGLIVWEPRDRAARDDRAKAAVRLNFRRHVIRPPGQEGVRRRIAYSNALRTTGYVHASHLRDPRYVLLWGELE